VPSRPVPAPQLYEGGDKIVLRAEPVIDEDARWRFRYALAVARRRAVHIGLARIGGMAAPDEWLATQLTQATDSVGGRTQLVGLHAWAVASVGVLNVDGIEQQAMVFRFGTVVQGILTVGAESGCISKPVVDGACHVSVRPLTAPWPADHAVGPSPARESTAFGLLPDSAERDAGVVAGQPGVCVASGDSDSNGAAALILWHQQGMVAKDASPSVRWNGSMAAYPLHDTLEDAAAELFQMGTAASLASDSRYITHCRIGYRAASTGLAYTNVCAHA